eukprot:13156875-Ditylum_brightwellii.AAC.1
MICQGRSQGALDVFLRGVLFEDVVSADGTMSGLCCSGLGEIGLLISEAFDVPLGRACLELMLIFCVEDVKRWYLLRRVEGFGQAFRWSAIQRPALRLVGQGKVGHCIGAFVGNLAVMGARAEPFSCPDWSTVA